MSALQKELSSLRHSQQLLVFLIFTLVTIVIWVSISIITTQKKTAISAESQQLAEPLNPSINTAVLEAIEQKRQYGPTELSNFPIYTLTIEGDQQRMAENPRDIAPTTDDEEATSSDLNSLLPPVTVDPTLESEATNEETPGSDIPVTDEETTPSPTPTSEDTSL